MSPLPAAGQRRMQGLKPTMFRSPMCGPTEVVPCYKAHEFNILRGVFSSRTGANSDAFALPAGRLQAPEESKLRYAGEARP
jgi:hypothetical protein